MRGDRPPKAAFGASPKATFGASPLAAFGPRPLGRLPSIRRARGFRLYDAKGQRYLDLFRDGALLGHRAEGTLTVMKSVLSQGLAASLPSLWEQRLLGALARQFPGCVEVRLYASAERALGAARRHVGEPESAACPFDPALDTGPDRAPPEERVLPVALWRPFLPETPARAVLPVLPFTVDGVPAPVCFFDRPSAAVPLSDAIAGFILAGATRGLLAVTGRGRQPLSNPVLEHAVDSASGWARRGPYVRAVCEESQYASVHEAFLREGVLLCPWFPGPSVLPGESSPGETRRLADLFTQIPGG